VFRQEKAVDQLRQWLVNSLQDLLHAEMQLVKALPKMAEAARHPKLKELFTKHLQQTEGHVDRLQSGLELLGEKPQPKSCLGMKGLIEEGEETIDETGEVHRRSRINSSVAILHDQGNHPHESVYGGA
jgi:Mn-containing catalase